MAVSEIAELRERLANEYMAAKWGLTGLAYGIPKHEFITARMERMGESQKELEAYVGKEQAISLVAETLVTLPEKPERSAILAVIEHLLGHTEETEYLLDHIREMWETIDMLTKRFGQEDAYKIIKALGYSFSDR